MRSAHLLGCLALCCVLAAPAQAGFLYQFADAAGTPTNTFTISGVGNTVDVRVYLQEDPSPGLLASEGLFSASLNLKFDAPSGIAEVLAAGDITPNPLFTNIVSGPSITSTNGGFTGDVGLDPFLLPDGTGRVLLVLQRYALLEASTPQEVTADLPLWQSSVTPYPN